MKEEEKEEKDTRIQQLKSWYPMMSVCVKSYELSIRLFLFLSLSISSLSFDDLLFAALVWIWLQLSFPMAKIRVTSVQIRLEDWAKSGQIISFTCLFHKKHAFLHANYAIRHLYINVLIHKSSSCPPLSVVFTSSSLPIFQVNFLFSLFSYIRTIVKGTMLALITLPGLSTIESKRGWVWVEVASTFCYVFI